MKKTTMFVAAALAVLAVGCSKKSDNNSTSPTSGTGSITINGVSYNETLCKDTVTNNFFGEAGNLLGAQGYTSDRSKSHITYLIFKNNAARPTAGSYHIGTGATNYVGIVLNDSSAAGQGLYSSDTITNLSTTVAVNSGKITATIPTIKLTGFFTPVGGSTHNDTVTVSGTVVEQ